MKTLTAFLVLSLIYLPLVLAEELTARRVTSGDRLVLSDGREIQLIGVDCPDLEDPSHNFNRAVENLIDPSYYSTFAAKSKQFLTDFVTNKTLRTEMDPIHAIVGHHDEQGRFLAYLYLEDGLLVNAVLIDQGYCLSETRLDFRHKDKFLAYEKDAKRNQRGFWGGPNLFSQVRQAKESQDLISEHSETARRAAQR